MKIKSFLITAVLATAILCFGATPNITKAACSLGNEITCQINALMDQIKALQAQIAQLQAQQGQGQAWCHTFNANIGMGQKTGNPEIEALVTALQKEELLDQGASFDGYDETLASAVTGFQEKYASEILTPSNLKHGTGYVGKATRAKLNALYGCRIACTQEAKQCPDGSYVSRTGPNCEFAKCPKTQCTTDSDCPQPTCSAPVGSSAPTCYTSPVKCVDGKCVSTSTQSSITILSPNGGESYNIGTNSTITWKTTRLNEGVISINLNTYPTGNIESYPFVQNSDNDGNFPWGVGKSMIGDVPAGAYVMQVCVKYSDGKSECDQSDSYFKIVSTLTQSFVTIISPNGGETYKIGDTITVNWKTAGVSPSQNLDVIRLRAYPNGQEYNLAYNVLNDGQEIITLPSSVPAGAYTLEIKSYVNNILVFDASDSYFKISTTTATCTDSDGGVVTDVYGATYVKLGSFESKHPDECALVSNYDNNGNPVGWQGANSCSGKNCYIEEAYCRTNEYGDVIDADADKLINCPNGCLNGACARPTACTPGQTASCMPPIGGTQTCNSSGQWGNCVSSTQPSVTLVYPKNGYTWYLEDQNFEFVWTSSNFGTSSIWVYIQTNDDKYIPVALSVPNTGSYILPKLVPLTGSIIQTFSPGSYKALVCGQFQNTTSATYSVCSNTANITISSRTQIQPSITVTSPNGGETWKVGETHNITWTVSNFGSMGVSINLLNPSATGAAYLKNIALNISNTGSYQWTIPSDIPVGTYKLMLASYGGTALQDYSDNYFSIVAATTQAGGPLNVSLDASTPVAQNLSLGQTNVTFAKIKLTNTTNTGINNLNGIQVAANADIASSKLMNIKVYDGATQLGTTQASLVFNGSYYYAWVNVNGVSIPSVTTKTLTLVADVKSDSPAGAVTLGIAGLNFDSPGGTTTGMPVYGNAMTTVAPTICVPNWSCTAWSTCSNSAGAQQTRTCTDSNNCGVTTDKPAITRSCTVSSISQSSLASISDALKMIAQQIQALLAR